MNASMKRSRPSRHVRLTVALFFAGITALFLGIGAVQGCSQTNPRLGENEESLIEASVVATVPSAEFQPSAVKSRGKYVVGYDDITRASPLAMAGWAFSTDGQSWNRCNMVDPGAYLHCNVGNASLASGQASWLGQASLVADGLGNVVYVGRAGATGTSTTPSLIIATISTNDGQTFGKGTGTTKVVNETGGDCDGGTQDLPNATFDFTTSPATLWVVWRHKAGSSFGGCVRRGQIVSGLIQWIEPAHSIGGMDRENEADSNMGQGGMRIQAGDGAVSVAYSNNDELTLCPDFTKTMSIRWGMVTSLDNGHDWGDRTSIFHTDFFQPCTLGGRVQNSLRAFDFVRAPDGNYYFAVNDAPVSIRLFHSVGSGIKPQSSNEFIWREWCPGSPTSDAGSLPFSNWTQPGATCSQSLIHEGSNQTAFFPTLAADGVDRLSLSFYEGTNTDKKHIHVAYKGALTPRAADGGFQDATLSAEFIPNNIATVVPDASPDADGTPNTLGQYMTMVAENPPSPDSCSDAGAFDPYWTWLSPASGMTQVQTVQVQLQ